MQAPSQTQTSIRPSDVANRSGLSDRISTKPILTIESGECRHARPVRQDMRGHGVNKDDSEIQQDQLFAEFQPLVRRLIRQYGENSEIRNDLEGEIYYRFCLILKAYDPDRGVPLRPYIVRQLSASIYTFARQRWRNQHREVSLQLFTCESGPTQSIDPTRDWDDAIDLQQFKRSLPDAIAKLSERQRNVLIWRYYEDRSFEEIAGKLGIQTATARSLLRHALTHLRADMAVHV